MLTRVSRKLCTQLVQGGQFHSHRVLGVPVFPGRKFSSRDDIQGSGPNINLSQSAGAQPLSVEGYQGNFHEFSAGRAQDIIDRATEEMKMSREERQESVQQGIQDVEAAYSHTGNVSLHSVMEDGVPTPSKARPNHRNMPNHGGIMDKIMFTSGQYDSSHPSKNYISYSGAQGSKKQEAADAYVGAQGVQGAQDMHGMKTQPSADVDDRIQGIQGSEVAKLLKAESPCPQGIQGHDCDRFKLWLNNCVKYGFVNCDEQLQGIQTGRRTLSEIFEEQDALIRQAVNKFSDKQVSREGQEKPSSATCGSSTNALPNPDQPENPKKLSQKQKLQLAVKQYGATVVIFHVTMSLGMLGCFYVAVSSGLDVVGMLQSVGIGEKILQSKAVTGASTFVIAYASYKVFAPLRIAITLSVTPFLVQYLRRIGMLKPPKPS